MTDTAAMFDSLPPGPTANGYAVGPAPNEFTWHHIAPIRDDAPEPPPLKGSQRWWYRDAEGRSLFAVDRYEPRRDGERKQFIPLTLWQNDSGELVWKQKHPPAKRPLYGLDRLAGRPDAPVLIPEGEKAADIAAELFPDHVVITSSGGSNAALQTDCSSLAGRVVVIWPDNDGPGRKYAADVARLATTAGAASVRIVEVPEQWPEGWDLADALPDGVTLETLRRLLEDASDRTAPPSGPDMSIVRRAVTPAPNLDISVFGPLATWIAHAAESKSAPVDYVAMPLLGSAAGAIGAARWVSPWPGWGEPAILWVKLVGLPSAGKSPAMDAVREPLAAVERDAAASWPETRRSHETAQMAAEAHREQWESAARAAVKDGRPAPPKPLDADEPEAPQMPRIVITDATIEATACILAGNPRGLVLWRDECSAWLGNLGKYGDGDRAFWLEAYGGRSYIVDRKKHPEPLRIEHVAVSIVGGIQPDRLATLLMSGDDDGMAARFLYTWPDSVSPIRPLNRSDGRLITRALGRLHKLEFQHGLEGGRPQPVTLPVEPTALDVFQAWRVQHHAASQSASGLMASSLGKMPGQALRLALVLELLWWAAGPDGTAEPRQVSVKALNAALELIDGYFKPMLARVLGEAAQPQIDRHAAVLARAILSHRADRINARQVRRDWRLPGLREGPAVAAAIGALEEAGWLVPAGGRDGGSAGRQRSDFMVDPRVHGRQGLIV